jgi:hypothetical protein
MGRSERMASKASATVMVDRHSARPAAWQWLRPSSRHGQPAARYLCWGPAGGSHSRKAGYLRKTVKVEMPRAAARWSDAGIAAEVQPAALQQGRQLSEVQPRQTEQTRIRHGVGQPVQPRRLARIGGGGGHQLHGRVALENQPGQFGPVLQRPFPERRAGVDGKVNGVGRDVGGDGFPRL